MQRLEVSGAVRPLQGSLGVKGLIDFRLLAHRSTLCQVQAHWMDPLNTLMSPSVPAGSLCNTTRNARVA